MSEIQVGGGPVHNRVDVALVSEVNDSWMAILKELESPTGEHGINNNELKERFNRFAQAAQALHASVAALPPQGRTLHFKGSSIARVTEQMGRILKP